jgi:hypothetical protein
MSEFFKLSREPATVFFLLRFVGVPVAKSVFRQENRNWNGACRDVVWVCSEVRLDVEGQAVLRAPFHIDYHELNEYREAMATSALREEPLNRGCTVDLPYGTEPLGPTLQVGGFFVRQAL